jgi:hypothetical protein
MQEKLAYGCRKSRDSDAGKTGLLMQKKLVSRCGKTGQPMREKPRCCPWTPIYDRHGSGRWVLEGTKAR